MGGVLREGHDYFGEEEELWEGGKDCMSEVIIFLVWGVCFMGFW